MSDDELLAAFAGFQAEVVYRFRNYKDRLNGES